MSTTGPKTPAVDQAVSDPSVRVAVFSAEGRAFVAGGDLAHFRDSADKRAAAAQLIGPIHGGLERLAASPVITIGSVKGAVAGAGMSLALNLDLVVAADDAAFNLAYARIGASPIPRRRMSSRTKSNVTNPRP